MSGTPPPPRPRRVNPILSVPASGPAPAPAPAPASASVPAAAPALALREAASAPNPLTHFRTSGQARPFPPPAIQANPEAEPGPQAWERQMDIVTAETRKLKRMLQKRQRQYGEQRQVSSSSSSRGGGAGPSTKKQRQNLGPGVDPLRQCDPDRFEEMTREIEAVHNLLGNYFAGAAETGPLARAGLAATTRAAAGATPRQSHSASSGSYLPQLKAVLRQHADPAERLRIFQEQLDDVLHAQEAHGGTSSHYQVIRQLLEAIEEERCLAREEARSGPRSDEARRHGDTPSPVASTSPVSQAGTAIRSGSQSSREDVGAGLSSRSLCVVSAPCSFGPQRSGNPDQRDSRGSGSTRAVHSAPARIHML